MEVIFRRDLIDSSVFSNEDSSVKLKSDCNFKLSVVVVQFCVILSEVLKSCLLPERLSSFPFFGYFGLHSKNCSVHLCFGPVVDMFRTAKNTIFFRIEVFFLFESFIDEYDWCYTELEKWYVAYQKAAFSERVKWPNKCTNDHSFRPTTSVKCFQ